VRNVQRALRGLIVIFEGDRTSTRRSATRPPRHLLHGPLESQLTLAPGFEELAVTGRRLERQGGASLGGTPRAVRFAETASAPSAWVEARGPRRRFIRTHVASCRDRPSGCEPHARRGLPREHSTGRALLGRTRQSPLPHQSGRLSGGRARIGVNVQVEAGASCSSAPSMTRRIPTSARCRPEGIAAKAVFQSVTQDRTRV